MREELVKLASSLASAKLTSGPLGSKAIKSLIKKIIDISCNISETCCPGGFTMTNHAGLLEASEVDVVRAWKDEDYRLSLSPEQLTQVLPNPAGEFETSAPTLDDMRDTAYSCYPTYCC